MLQISLDLQAAHPYMLTKIKFENLFLDSFAAREGFREQRRSAEDSNNWVEETTEFDDPASIFDEEIRDPSCLLQGNLDASEYLG